MSKPIRYKPYRQATKDFSLGDLDELAFLDTVDTAQIVDGAITAVKIGAAAVTVAKLKASEGTNAQVLTNVSGTSVAWAELPGSTGTWTYGTDNSTIGGTSIAFTGIPAGITELEMFVRGMSFSAANETRVRVGPAAGLVDAGYVGRVSDGNTVVSWSAGAQLDVAQVAADSYLFTIRLALIKASTNVWHIESSGLSWGSAARYNAQGYIALAGSLALISIMPDGADTIDANSSTQIRYR